MKKIEFYFRFRYPFERCFENDVLKAFQFHSQKTSTLNSYYLTHEDFVNSEYFELFKPFYDKFKHPNIEKLKNAFSELKNNNGFNSNCLIFTLENWGGDFLDFYSSERNKIETGFAAIKEIRKDGFVYCLIKVSKTKDNSCAIVFNTREYFVPYTLTFEHLNDLINIRIHNIINEKTVDYLAGKSPNYKSLEERAKSLQSFLDYHYENYPPPKKIFLDFIGKKKSGISDYVIKKQDNWNIEDIELVKTFNNWLDNKIKDLEILQQPKQGNEINFVATYLDRIKSLLETYFTDINDKQKLHHLINGHTINGKIDCNSDAKTFCENIWVLKETGILTNEKKYISTWVEKNIRFKNKDIKLSTIERCLEIKLERELQIENLSLKTVFNKEIQQTIERNKR